MILSLKEKKKTKSTIKVKHREDGDLYAAYEIAIAGEEKKGENISILDISKLTIISDYFIIITAKSSVQIEAIAKYIEEKLAKLNYNLVQKEGFLTSNWVILDFGNIVVHIMSEKERNYYRLESFWTNATLINNKMWKKAL